MPDCTETNKKGEPCRAPALKGRPYCALHDPDRAEQAREAQRKGGRAGAPRALDPAAARPWWGTANEAGPVISASDVCALLADTIEQVRTGQLDPRVGNCVGVLASHLLRALAVSETDRRLDSLEAALLLREGSQ